MITATTPGFSSSLRGTLNLKGGALGVRATLASARLAMTRGEEEAIRRLAPDLAPILQSEDAQEGLQSFIERRQAHFKGQ